MRKLINNIIYTLITSILVLTCIYLLLQNKYARDDLHNISVLKNDLKNEMQQIRFDISNKNDQYEIEKQAWNKYLMCKSRTIVVSYE